MHLKIGFNAQMLPLVSIMVGGRSPFACFDRWTCVGVWGPYQAGLQREATLKRVEKNRHCGLAGAQASWFCKLSKLCFPRWPYCAILPYATPFEHVSPCGETAADPIMMASHTLFCPVSSRVFFPGPLQARLLLNIAGSAPTRQC